MEEGEICTICLDVLFPDKSSLITKIKPCGHYYHSHCLDTWKERSNNCPTCREDYNIAETIDIEGDVLSTNFVTKLANIPINHDEFFLETFSDLEIEEEADDRILRRINRLVSASNICILCDQRRGNVTACSVCSSSFHYTCLALGASDYWVCPMCETEQRLLDRPNRSRRARNSAITNRVYNQHRDLTIPTNSEPVSLDIKEVAEPMSVEEQHSWEVFEQASNERVNDQDIVDSINLEPTTAVTSNAKEILPEVRKFKRPTRGKKRHTVATEIEDPQATPIKEIDNPKPDSLVNKILGQIKENRPTQSRNLTPTFFEPTRPIISYLKTNQTSPTLTYSSPQSSSESSNISPQLSPVLNCEDDQTTSTNPNGKSKTEIQMQVLPPGELTYEQKFSLQETVRSKLRPIYKKGDINDEQYTIINKKVSHILYDFFAHDVINGSAKHTVDSVAEYHVTQELMKL